MKKAGTMNKLTKYLNAAVLGALILIEGTSKVSAAVIYSQTFNGGTGSLVSTTPTTGVGAWTGDNIINRNGLLEGGWGAVSLAFTPTSGLVYDLTATINTTSGTWIGVGFLESNTTYGFFGDKTNPTLLNTKTQWQAWAGPGDNYDKTSNDVLIRLDTTGPQWTTSMYQGGIQIGSTYTYTSGNPTINYVGFVSEGSEGTVSAFQLTAIPEPHTSTLASIALFLAFRKRKKQDS